MNKEFLATMSLTAPEVTVLSVEEARQRSAAHHERASALVADHVSRRAAGERHPIFDFLFEYYPIRPAHLKRWHPGVGIALPDSLNSEEFPQATWRYYHNFSYLPTAPYSPADSSPAPGNRPPISEEDADRFADYTGVITVNAAEYVAQRGATMDWVENLLRRTETNPTHFDCFGLHEWAMVYRISTPRHSLPLRLGAEGTNAVVESHNIRCTHMDAYRFFTPAAAPLNLTVLSRESQPDNEQRACLHAGMDLYKWASKLLPLVPGDLWLDTFELARDIRVLDMEASPYDCRELGFGVVPIETPEGKAAYVARQREFADRASILRTRLLEVISTTRALA